MEQECDRNQWHGILVYLELQSERICEVSLELMTKACEMGRQQGEPVYGVLVGQNVSKYEGLLRQVPAERICLFECSSEGIRHRMEAMRFCIDLWRPSSVLIGGTMEGRMLAPALAVAYRTGVTADCTALELTGRGELIQSRPAFGGSLMADIMTVSRPQIATVRPGVFLKEEWTDRSSVELFYPELPAVTDRIRLCSRTEQPKREDITMQRVLVAAGRGIRRKEDLDQVRELAELLGGGLASSRGLVEKGWMPPERQIGLSGQTVRPELLLTIGISGTVQFAAGMKHAGTVIAINEDPHAPIFQMAHHPICGDLYQIIPKLLDELKRKKEKQDH